jgi:hypothetical protein
MADPVLELYEVPIISVTLTLTDYVMWSDKVGAATTGWVTGQELVDFVQDNLSAAVIGESNSGINVGAGGDADVFSQKNGVNLEFRRLIGGTNVTITEGAETITIDAASGGAGEVNTASNQGGGEELALAKSGVDLPFKTLVAGANIAFTVGAETIEIEAVGGVAGETNTASNVGLGEGLFKQKTGADLEFRSIIAGTNISFSTTTDGITVNAAATGGMNISTGSNDISITTEDVLIWSADPDPVTITLPDPALTNRRIDIKRTDATANSFLIDAFGSEKIESADAPFSLTNEGESLTLVSDGTDWWAL